MRSKLTLLVLSALLTLYGCNTKVPGTGTTKIIFDTDLGPDYDDVGALAFLHAMADSGKTEILATLASNKHELVVPSIETINNWFGRPGIPLGAPKGDGANMGSSQHWADSLVAGYPHTTKSTSDAPDAVNIYRQILAGSPDNSVTIVTVGFLTNLAALLRSEPDGDSPLNGPDLVRTKVKRLVSMAGRFPQGREFNVFIDSAASKFVYENWPGEIIFSGFEIGWEIRTGLKLIRPEVPESPVKDVFRISIPLSEEDSLGRMSWDQTAVLIAVYGTEGFFDTVKGRIIVIENGSNAWKNDPEGLHYYVVQKMPVAEMAAFIEERMMHQPMKKGL